MVKKTTSNTKIAAAAAVILISCSTQIVFGFEYRAPVASQQKHDINRISNNGDTNTFSPNDAANAAKSASSINTEDYCLVFEDHFDKFDLKNWQHEISLSGGNIL